jgi:2-polyprenyl-6-methoxyphenol hydroxylase-like FAD-dependent oxidoreductase
MNADRCVLPVDEVLTFDVVVVGGGLAAICAAIAAARNGCEVALLEMDPALGGNSGPMLGVHVSGAHSFHPYASETGIIEEIELEAARQRAKTRTWGVHYNLSHQWDLVLEGFLEGAGVRIFRNHQGRRALKEGRRVTGVFALDTEHFRTKLFRVRHAVVDGSGDGVVARDAGASFMWGTEARETFGERSAPEFASAETMGTSITALVRKCSRPVAFVMPPEFAERALRDGPPPKLTGYPASWNPDDECCFLWVTESGGNRNTLADAADIRREILYQLYRTWDNVKNRSFPDQARNWELTWVSPKSGKRESHRFVGDYVLTQTDVEAGKSFPDSIGYGGYGVDIHEPVGLGTRIVFHSIPPLWNFPYRCCYSRDFDNLWLAGRLMSVSHLALGTVRLMRTLACIGQGVGTAVALAKQHRCTAADIAYDHIGELQQTLLEQDATLLTATNRDPHDLARRAQVTASSETRHGATRLSCPLEGERTQGAMAPREPCPLEGERPRVPGPVEGERPCEPVPVEGERTQGAVAPREPVPVEGERTQGAMAPREPPPVEGERPCEPVPVEGERPREPVPVEGEPEALSNVEGRPREPPPTAANPPRRDHPPAFLPLDLPRGVQLWDWADRFDTVEFYIRNLTGQPQLLTLGLELFQAATPWKPEHPAGSFPHLKGRSAPNRMEWGCDNTLAHFAEIARTAAAVPPSFEGWLTFAFEPPVGAIPKDPTSDESRYNLVLDPCPEVELAVDPHWYDFALRLWRPDGRPLTSPGGTGPSPGGRTSPGAQAPVSRLVSEESYQVDGDCHAFRLSPAPTYGEAANVVNGHHRRYATNPVNAWLSDVVQPLPQDLTLTWDEPQEIARVQLTFDTIERAYRDAPINCDEPYARRCVTSYLLEAQTPAGWQTLADVVDNHQRHRIHRFAPVTAQAVRLTIRAVRDPAFRARVYEVRAYAR